MKFISKVAIIAVLFAAIPLTSAISSKSRLRTRVSGTTTQYPNGGDTVILYHKATERCLDMDTDEGLHIKTCKNDDDEKWKVVEYGSFYKFRSLLNDRYLKVANGGFGSTSSEVEATPVGKVVITDTSYLILWYYDNTDSEYYALKAKRK